MARVASEVPFDVGVPASPLQAPPNVPDPYDDEHNQDPDKVSGQRMERVIQILEDDNETDLAGAMRILAVEIATSLQPSRSALEYRDPRNANNRIKNLRELSKQIQESADMSSRDFLNFDGPRFQFVFREIMLLFRASMIKGGLPAETADHVLRVFYEEFLARELRLRQETSKLDPGTMASALTVESVPAQSSTGETDA